MASRGYKLQEFVAHAANVNCIKIGSKTCRKFITGGDDHKVNLWAIGKPTSLVSLCGHTSPVESVAFDSTEVFVAAGASAGSVKLWDLEETKVVRNFTGHRSYCTAVEFHPFGEFFASGSMDTNLKIWDIRKKGCIHTYKGHTRGISSIRFTPDGRWVVSGGLDNVVKIWDLTAGKLLHDFNFHEGHIRSLDFHPLEFLLATGSADRTVKFWDLETFELIGSTTPETTGVRSISFHPDGRTLFCGLDSSLKVYSWEPVICHDSVDMGWSTLGDLCVNDGKLLGCSYYQNSVGVWVSDVSLIEPYGDSPVAEESSHSEQKIDLHGNSLDGVGRHRRSTSTSSDVDSKEIKNIYVDNGQPVASRKDGSSPKAVNMSNTEDGHNLATHKQVPPVGSNAKNIGQTNTKSFMVPNVVPRDSCDEKDLDKTRRDSIANRRGNADISLKPPHTRTQSTSELDVERLLGTVETKSSEHLKSSSGAPKDKKIRRRLLSDDAAEVPSVDKLPIMKSVSEKSEEATLSRRETCEESLRSSKGLKSVKYVNGVAVVHGRTRSLVERFEKREKSSTNECQSPDAGTGSLSERDMASDILNQTSSKGCNMPHEAKTLPVPNSVSPIKAKSSPGLVVQKPDMIPQRMPNKAKIHNTFSRTMPEKCDAPPIVVVQTHDPVCHSTPEIDDRPNAGSSIMPEKADARHVLLAQVPDTAPHVIHQKAKSSPVLDDDVPQSLESLSLSRNENIVPEDLLQTHDVFVSTLRSRLTKLQVVKHFWDHDDIKGAINALRKLPDHSVQADVVSVLMEKMEALTLDLFSCLLPVLLGLLDSKTERHTTISLEMLLKLVGVFGPVVNSTISAPRRVGVDLHAEKRLECCNQCFIQLQKIQKALPTIIRRGGLQARCAQELAVILQDS